MKLNNWLYAISKKFNGVNPVIRGVYDIGYLYAKFYLHHLSITILLYE